MKGGLVAAILIGALALRVAEVERTSFRPINDAGSYLTLASEIAHTGDYSLSHNPGSGAGGTRGPSAYFAPGYPYFLALVDIVDGHETRRGGAIQPARVSQAVLGTITVALIGLVALEMFGPSRRPDRARPRGRLADADRDVRSPGRREPARRRSFWPRCTRASACAGPTAPRRSSPGWRRPVC